MDAECAASMKADDILATKQKVIERFGPWTAGCIHLTDRHYTFDQPHWDSRLRRFTQIVGDLVGKPLEGLRVLDLACLEGQYGIEFALHGAEVLAIEGREANLAKVRFAKEALSLDQLKLELGDVRALSESSHGHFDVVLCLGILYHLDAPDVMDLLERMYSVCSRITIIDTHFSPYDETPYRWKGKTYWGRYMKEHKANATEDEKLAAVWNSLDNVRAFQLTRASLCNLLRDVGFTSVYECLNPYEYHNPNWPHPGNPEDHVVWKHRTTFVALKGSQQRLLSSPLTDSSTEIDRPEHSKYEEDRRVIESSDGRSLRGLRHVARFLPRRLKAVLRKRLTELRRTSHGM
jgi:SAM-dependent methyltransferase